MTAPRAVVFDLGGTLVHWADWEEGAAAKWGAAHDALRLAASGRAWPDRQMFVDAMRAAEKAHWARVDREHWANLSCCFDEACFSPLRLPADRESTTAKPTRRERLKMSPD